MEMNPFGHDRFGWIDGNLGIGHEQHIKICENYSPNKILQALEYTKSDKFHIQILNVLDKKYKNLDRKREMYQQYRWVVCGCFFTYGKSVGQKILQRLREIFQETTIQGYGHGEKMFFFEILDEFYDEIERSYGDYGQIINNWQRPTLNIYYIYELILKNYYDKKYYQEASDCAYALMLSFHTYNIQLEYWMYMHILEIWYISNDSCFKDKVISENASKRIQELYNNDVLLKKEYQKRADHFDSVFRINTQH